MTALQPLSSSQFVHTVLAGLQRQLAKPKAKKEPITVEMLTPMVQSSDGSLPNLRLMAMSLLALALLRCDELIKLCTCDVSFAAEHIDYKLAKE